MEFNGVSTSYSIKLLRKHETSVQYSVFSGCIKIYTFHTSGDTPCIFDPNGCRQLAGRFLWISHKHMVIPIHSIPAIPFIPFGRLSAKLVRVQEKRSHRRWVQLS